jgi:predicted ATPase
MIKRFTIKNFKVISSLSLEFTPLTVLIGENSCGKSTVLQALDFLSSITFRDIDEYLKDRDWDFDEIKSQLAKAEDAVCFAAEFDIEDIKLFWEISINNVAGKWMIEESIVNAESKECYLSFGKQRRDIPYDFSQLNVKSSALKMLDIERSNSKDVKYDPVLIKLKALLTSSSSFELLSPDRMRSRGSRGKVNDIGMGGEKLAAYIYGMPVTRRSELNRIVSEFIGYEVKITTTTKGQPGWVEMFLEETWNQGAVRVKKRYISDGLLRIIAFAAILVNQDGRKPGQLSLLSEDRNLKGFILLDEIEDGINPSLSEKLIKHFTKAATASKRQVVVTSHSPVMVNFVDQNSIQFMWRDQDGMIHVKPLFQTEQMQETLEFLHPGEVWLNYSKANIIAKLSAVPEEEH